MRLAVFTLSLLFAGLVSARPQAGLLRKVPFAAPADCPAGTCTDTQMCCMLQSGEWGCCPFKDAVCCNDELHCCPSGYTCDLEKGTCTMGDNNEAPMKVREPAAAGPKAVICPDGHSKCPNGNTCCKQASGQWGCCPLPNAVCCSDGVHCCPNRYTCDVSAGTCTKGNSVGETVQMLVRKPAAVICPDEKRDCPDGQTCCPNTSGGCGCCPAPNAVCCDEQHCCPEGYTCDVSAGTCTKGDTIPWFTKMPARPKTYVL